MKANNSTHFEFLQKKAQTTKTKAYLVPFFYNKIKLNLVSLLVVNLCILPLSYHKNPKQYILLESF